MNPDPTSVTAQYRRRVHRKMLVMAGLATVGRFLMMIALTHGAYD